MYRNVTPSFIVALSFFLSVLEQNGIDKVKVIQGLPFREQNRKLVTEHKIKIKTMYGQLDEDELEKFKQELEEKRIAIDNNVTNKFHNCFSRLQIHFEDLFLNGLNFDSNILYQINSLRTEQPFLKSVVSNISESKIKL